MFVSCTNEISFTGECIGTTLTLCANFQSDCEYHGCEKLSEFHECTGLVDCGSHENSKLCLDIGCDWIDFTPTPVTASFDYDAYFGDSEEYDDIDDFDGNLDDNKPRDIDDSYSYLFSSSPTSSPRNLPIMSSSFSSSLTPSSFPTGFPTSFPTSYSSDFLTMSPTLSPNYLYSEPPVFVPTSGSGSIMNPANPSSVHASILLLGYGFFVVILFSAFFILI